MQRFFDYWRRYVSVSRDAGEFLRQRAKVINYKAQSHFKWADESEPYWCVVLEGLAIGYTLNGAGCRSIEWFAGPMRDFTGVRHLHTPKGTDQAIQFCIDSTILRIPALHMRVAKSRYPEVSELLHVTHHYSEKLKNQLLRLTKTPDIYRRFAQFMELFRDFADQTTPDVHIDLLGMSRASYFRAKSHYLHTRHT